MATDNSLLRTKGRQYLSNQLPN